MSVELQEVVTLFRKADTDQDGQLTCPEFKKMLQSLEPEAWNEEVLEQLFKAADIDQNGTLDMKEFLDWIFGVIEEKDPEPISSKDGKGFPRCNTGGESSSLNSSAETMAPLEGEASMSFGSLMESDSFERLDSMQMLARSDTLGSKAGALGSSSSSSNLGVSLRTVSIEDSPAVTGGRKQRDEGHHSGALQPIRPPGAPRRLKSSEKVTGISGARSFSKGSAVSKKHSKSSATSDAANSSYNSNSHLSSSSMSEADTPILPLTLPKSHTAAGLEGVEEADGILEHEDSRYSIIDTSAGGGGGLNDTIRSCQSLNFHTFKGGSLGSEAEIRLLRANSDRVSTAERTAGLASEPLSAGLGRATLHNLEDPRIQIPLPRAGSATLSGSATHSLGFKFPRLSRSRAGSKPRSSHGPDSMSSTVHRLKPLLQDEPLTTIEELYELMTMREGRITGKLDLEDFLEIFEECRADGLGPRLAELVPQSCSMMLLGQPEDVTAMELASIFAMVSNHPDANEDEARLWKARVKAAHRNIDARRREDRRAALKEMGLQFDQPVGFGVFSRLLDFLGKIMHIDVPQFLVLFSYARTGRFELTTTMQFTLLNEVFLKCKKGTVEVVDQPITHSDFVKACSFLELTDNTWREGVPREELGLLYGQVLRHMQARVEERHEKRYRDRHSKKKARLRLGDVKYVVGRTQLSILIEELFKVLPMSRGRYRSPLNLVLSFLEKRRDSEHH
mmetsp:Transcript_45071/g.107104  ORF Transcript_45071/g.107104 Transcript_45071/m.107104 type:complete len:732 (-) Transcript_45071:151-2346(-)